MKFAGFLGLSLALASIAGCDKTTDTSTPAAARDADSGAVVEPTPTDTATPTVKDPSANITAPADPDPPGGPTPGEITMTDVPCASDADCVPQQCCHATTCGAPSTREACQDVACTMDCKADTMDCGGGCSCQDGKCATQLARFDG